MREGALRRAQNPAQNPVYLSPAYLPRLSRVLRLRALGLVKLLRVRLPRRFLLPARPLACPPRLI